MNATELQASNTSPIPERQAVPDYLELRQLVRERLQLSENPDPVRAINGLLTELSDDLLRLAAQKGLWAITGEVVRVDRRSAVRRDPQPSGKWDNALAAETEHPDLFAERVYVGDPDQPWKFLGDCTKQDLLAVAEHKRTHAQGVLVEADRYEHLARAVKRGQIVRDLSVDKVEGILNA